MRACNERDRRARRGRYSLRDLAAFADIERLLATDITGERHAHETPTDVIATSGLFDHSRKAACEGGGEQSLCTERALFDDLAGSKHRALAFSGSPLRAVTLLPLQAAAIRYTVRSCVEVRRRNDTCQSLVSCRSAQRV